MSSNLKEYEKYYAQKDLIPFGSIKIDKSKLKNNIISLYRNNDFKMNDFPNVYIDDKLKDAFKDIIKKRTPDISNLTSTERRYLGEVLTKAKIKHNIPKANFFGGELRCHCQSGSKINRLKNKYDLLLGEAAAGNDSRELKNMFATTIDEMVYNNIITRKQADAAMHEFNYDVANDGDDESHKEE